MRGNKLTILAAGTFVRGDVFSEDTLVVEGGVEGNLTGERVIVKARGWIHGDVSCKSLSIEPGGMVDGAMIVSEGQSLLLPGREQAQLPGGGDSVLPESAEAKSVELPLEAENPEPAASGDKKEK